MKKLILAVSVLVLVSGCICSHTVPLKCTGDIQNAHAQILPEYVKYVEADPNLTPAKKNDRKVQAEALKTATMSLEHSLEK